MSEPHHSTLFGIVKSLRRVHIGTSVLAFTLVTGCSYHEGEAALQAGNAEQAAEHWRSASDLGDPQAKLALARLYLSGEGIPRDPVAAEQLVKPMAETAAEWRRVWAQEVLADAYQQQGKSEEAVRWYKEAMDLGNPSARNKLATAYFEGNGVPKDIVQAIVLYKEGAETGNREARTVLAGLYATGTGVPQDLKRAASLYQQAQAAGDPWAQLRLAEMYLNGRGVPKDPIEAARLYQLAADAGNDYAMTALADLYKSGTGVNKDPKKAAELI